MKPTITTPITIISTLSALLFAGFFVSQVSASQLPDDGVSVPSVIADTSFASVPTVSSLDRVMDMVWGSILGNEHQHPAVSRLLSDVPVPLSGVLPVDGTDHVFLGIGYDYWSTFGGKNLYRQLSKQFPEVPLHLEPSAGVQRLSGSLPTVTGIRTVQPVSLFSDPLSFSQTIGTDIADNGKQQVVVGRLSVPNDVVVGSVAVSVDITHPFRSDLKVDLVTPSGVVVSLFDGVQGGIDETDDLVDTFSVPAKLQGQRAQGTWKLRVGDYESGDSGTMNSWKLSVTPAQDAPATEEPANLFLETFQEGLGAWRTTAWETVPFEGIPGEATGNIAARAQGCSICFLFLKNPIDLSAHDSVTLSFSRNLSTGMGINEFLGLDIGNNGSFRRLKTWNHTDGDGQWHQETFTLEKDDLGENFSLRFFGITTNDFTSLAIDNVLISAKAGSVVVTPDPTEPDLAVTEVTAPATAEPGQRIELQATVTNTNAPTKARFVIFYRHTKETETPKTGGIPVAGKLTSLATNETKAVTASTTAPATPGTYHYYTCVTEIPGEDTENNCTATAVVVGEETTEPEVPDTEDPETTEEGIAITMTTEVMRIIPDTLMEVAFTVTVTNNTDSPIEKGFSIYRHNAETDNPASEESHAGGVTSGTLEPSESFEKKVSDINFKYGFGFPEVWPTTFYYYACIEDVCSDAVSIPVSISPIMVTEVTATPQYVHEGHLFTLTATVTNTGNTTENATISIYRTDYLEDDPITDGVKEPNGATTGTLTPRQSVTITSTHEAPMVPEGFDTHPAYYFVCVDEVCNSGPVGIVVREMQDTEITGCQRKQSNPMGGDSLYISSIGCAGTITLGGVEDVNGIRGFVTSGHVAAPDSDEGNDYSQTGMITSLNESLEYPLGTIFKMPSFFINEVIDEYGNRILSVDAAFGAYPSRHTPDCPSDMTWSSHWTGIEKLCFKVGTGEQIDRLAPLKIRGEGDTVYTVVGSREPREGETIWASGSRTGRPLKRIAGERKVLTGGNQSAQGEYRGFVNYALVPSEREHSRTGDSGGPIYTNPDVNGNVFILGVLIGTFYTDLNQTVDDQEVAIYSLWRDVEDEFDLKPIGK